MLTENQNELFDLLPESIIKVDRSMKVTYRNQFFTKHYPGINNLKDLIGSQQSVFLINSRHEPLRLEELPESIAFKTKKDVYSFIVGSNNTILREIKWLSITCRPILNELNECEEVLSIIKDISSFYISDKAGYKNMQMYRDHLEKSGKYMFRIGFQPKKHFLYVSSSIHETFGYTADEYMDDPNLFIENIFPDDVDKYQKLLENNFKTQNRVRLRFNAKDGSIKWCDISFFPHFYGNTNELDKLEGIISNVTNYEHQKSELEIKEKILQSIINKSNSFQYSCENDSDYTMHYLDQDFSRITGYSVDSVLNNAHMSYNEIIHFQDREMVHQKIDECIIENRVWNIEYRIKHAEGHYIWVREFGLAHKGDQDKNVLSGIVVDINKTKSEEDIKKRQSKNYQNIVTNSKLGIWEWNIPSGETFFNERWAEIIGYTIEELQPINIDTWVNNSHPVDLERSNQILQKHFKGETELYECDVRMKHKSGEWIWVRDTGRVTSWDKNGNPLSMSGVHQDITRLKKIEEDLQQKLEFEKVLANVSKNFIAGDVNFDVILDNAFEELGQITRASRIYIFLLRDGKQIMDNTHEWCAEGVSREIENLQNLPVGIFPWWMDQLHQGKIIQIPDVSRMPEEAKAEKEILESQDIKSLIVVGLRVRGELIGFIGFDDVMKAVAKWDKQEQYLLLWMSQIFSNVFENKWNKEKLIKSESKFRNIFEKNPSPQLLIDPENGDILDANQAALFFYGFTESEILLKNFIQLSNPQEIIEKEQLQQQLNLLSNNSYLEYQQMTSNSKLRKLELFGGKIEIDQTEVLHIIMHDITNQYSVMDRNLILRAAIDSSSIGVFITDSEGIVEDMNKTAMSLSAYHLDELRGKNIAILDADNYTETHYVNIVEHIQSGRVYQDEVLRKRKDGKEYWVNLSLVPVKDSNNELTKVVRLEENIDEKKKQLIALKEAKKVAEESNRLKSAFLSTINHELRTPLNHIIGLSGVIQEMASDDSILEFGRIINRSGMNLLEIVEDILNLAIHDQEEQFVRNNRIKILDLYLSLKENLSERYNKSAKQDKIQLVFTPDSAFMNHEIISDQNKVIMIFNNLFKNALKFTNEGSIEFGMKVLNDQLQLYVKDTGIGIPSEMKDIIFEHFRQIDDSNTRQYEGVGIGLTIAQKAAQALGAEIKLESEIGKGSTFSLIFPNHELKKDMGIQTSSEGSDIPDFSQKNILIVEDDDDSLLVTKMMIQKTKAKYKVAGNGKIALDMASEEDFDLILMDLKMPEMDGYDATRLIMKLKPHQKIIGLTAYSFVDDRNKALEAGCIDVLSKPINKVLMYQSLSKHIST
jgi:PAS domain S-box-containing protein